METNEQAAAGQEHESNVTLTVQARPPSGHTVLARSVAETEAFSFLQRPPGRLPGTYPAALCTCVCKKVDIRHVLQAAGARAAATTPQAVEIDRKETDWQNQRSSFPSVKYESGGREGRDTNEANAILRTTTSRRTTGKNKSSVCCRKVRSTNKLQRCEHTRTDSICNSLRENSDHPCIRHSKLTDRYGGARAALDSNPRCKGTRKSASHVDTATRSSHGLSAIPPCVSREVSSSGTSLKEGEAWAPDIRAHVCQIKEAWVKILNEQLCANPSALPPGQPLPPVLLRLPSLAAAYSRYEYRRDASPPRLNGITRRDLITALRVLRGCMKRNVATQKVDGGATARIQMLPPGKLQDYYRIGPILDVCLLPQQQGERHSRTPAIHKRLYSTERPQDGGSLKENCVRKIRRRGSLSSDQQESEPANSSSATNSRSAERPAPPDVKPVVEPQMLERKQEHQDITLQPPNSRHVHDYAIENQHANSKVGINLPSLSPEDRGNGSPAGRLGRESVNLQSSLSKAEEQHAPEIACTGGRPVLRFAVERHVIFAVGESPLKIIKSIDKQRIPASAGGDRLWRRLCERLLNLPRHPNVLAMEAIFEDPSHFHFVFERLEGGELFAFLLKERFINEHVCQYIIYQILMALHHLHSHNLLHRDIKPENLVFRRRKRRPVERCVECSNCASSSSQNFSSSSSSTLFPSSPLSEKCSPPSSQSCVGARGEPLLMSNISFKSPSSGTNPCTAGSVDECSSFTVNQRLSVKVEAGTLIASSGATACCEAHTSHTCCSSVHNHRKSGRRHKLYHREIITSLESGSSRKWETVEHKDGEAHCRACADKALRRMKRDYELVLIDFDTCKMMEVSSEEYGEVVGGRRRLVGTYGYLAPEVLCGHPYSTQSDLWSVGIILYILMTGYPPLPMEEMVSAGSSLNVFLRVHERHKGIELDVPPLSKSPLAQDLCRRLLCLSPKERLSSTRVALSHPWFDALNRARGRQAEGA